MLTIHVLICVPFPGEKRPFPADDLSSKKCGECWVFLQDKVVSQLQFFYFAFPLLGNLSFKLLKY